MKNFNNFLLILICVGGLQFLSTPLHASSTENSITDEGIDELSNQGRKKIRQVIVEESSDEIIPPSKKKRRKQRRIIIDTESETSDAYSSNYSEYSDDYIYKDHKRGKKKQKEGKWKKRRKRTVNGGRGHKFPGKDGGDDVYGEDIYHDLMDGPNNCYMKWLCCAHFGYKFVHRPLVVIDRLLKIGLLGTTTYVYGVGTTDATTLTFLLGIGVGTAVIEALKIATSEGSKSSEKELREITGV